MMRLKRTLFYILSVIFCFLLQTSVFQFLKLADVMPNVLLILTVIGIGFSCGLLIDIFFGDVLGQYALLYLLIGYINGCFNSFFYEDDVLLPFGLLVINTLAYSFAIFFFFFALRGRFAFFSYLKDIMIPEAVYTGLIALPLYKLLLFIDVRISDSEKRSMF